MPAMIISSSEYSKLVHLYVVHVYDVQKSNMVGGRRTRTRTRTFVRVRDWEGRTRTKVRGKIASCTTVWTPLKGEREDTSITDSSSSGRARADDASTFCPSFEYYLVRIKSVFIWIIFSLLDMIYISYWIHCSKKIMIVSNLNSQWWVWEDLIKWRISWLIILQLERYESLGKKIWVTVYW